MRHQKADIRHLMIPHAGLGYILAPILLCPTWDPRSMPCEGGWGDFSLQELKCTAEPHHSLHQGHTGGGGTLWLWESWRCFCPHELEIAVFTAWLKLKISEKTEQKKEGMAGLPCWPHSSIIVWLQEALVPAGPLRALICNVCLSALLSAGD